MNYIVQKQVKVIVETLDGLAIYLNPSELVITSV